MEILMKLKCSPTTPGAPPTHSTLKVVDHHHQLQQHTITRGSPRPNTATSNAIVQQQEMMLPPCMEYANCCSGTTPQQCELQWAQQQQQQHRRRNPQEYGSLYEPSVSYCSAVASGAPYETPPCCSGVGVGYSMHTSSPPQQATIPPAPPLVPTSYGAMHSNMLPADDYNMCYEYQEPEENFVSIDDAKIKGFLMKIGQEKATMERNNKKRQFVESRKLNTTTVTARDNANANSVIFEIIELDDEEEREKMKRIKNQAEQNAKNRPLQIRRLQPQQQQQLPQQSYPKAMKSPDISLIPKSPDTIPVMLPLTRGTNVRNSSKEKIIAQIELLDSSDSDTNDIGNTDGNEDDEEGLPFAAAAVSCELQCDDDDAGVNMVDNDVVVLQSDDDNIEFIDEPRETVKTHWNDYEEPKERTYFECFLCGKKVQSSYNLRRHMMIHTGERPFGCDMCDRRFREFSDLKKHRRRHANEPNFVCMVCRVNPPTEMDPTRCINCDSKSGVLLAATRKQTPSEKSLTPPVLTMTNKPISRNNTPAPNVTATIKTTPVLQPTRSVLPVRTISPSDIPPLTPISSNNSTNNNKNDSGSSTSNSDAQHLLDNVPAVHRPSYNQMGVMTRKEFPCPLCQRPFGTRHNLKRHFMIHTGEKPFNCTKCRKPFREFSTLKKHMVTHQRERWYKCVRCSLKFRDYLQYMDHKNIHPPEEMITPSSSSSSTNNTPTPKKKAKSNYSSSIYDDCYDEDDEDSSAEDWLECCECGRRFTDIEAYTEHLKEHDPNTYMYECYICKRTFDERADLVRHVAEHDVEHGQEDIRSTTSVDDNEIL